MSGGHVSDECKEWTGTYNIRLVLVPRGAHRQLGLVERNHGVRRRQLDLYEKDRLTDDLEQTLFTTSARNKMRGVRGRSPVMIFFGQSQESSGVCDEPFSMSQQSTLISGPKKIKEDVAKRGSSSKSFH